MTRKEAIELKSNIYHSRKLNAHVKYTDVNYGDIESYESPLIVNIAGCINTPYNHQNLNKIGRNDYYLIYVIKGVLKGKNPDGEATVTAGELMVIPPKKWYCIDCYADDTVYFFCVHFTGAQAKEKLKKYGISIFPSVNKLSADNQVQKRFKSIFDAFSLEDEYLSEELSSLLEQLFIEIARGIKRKESDKAPLSKSIRYINECYNTEIRTTDLAKMENMCMTAYNKAFKYQFGKSPINYIIGMRMQLAIELLETSDISIKEISFMCGYDNFNYFTRIFKQYIGKTPSEYRKNKPE